VGMNLFLPQANSSSSMTSSFETSQNAANNARPNAPQEQ
jgi:hypothetical protein